MRGFLLFLLGFGVVAGGFALAWQFVDPPPPRALTIAAGRPDGRYQKFARALAEKLKANAQIELTIVETAGSLENLSRLGAGDSRVDLALCQGGAATGAQNPSLRSLGSLFLEPVFVFYRVGQTPREGLRDLAGARIAVGETGSGTHAVALPMLAANGITPDNPRNGSFHEIGGKEAALALAKDEVDAAFFVVSPETELVRILLETPGVAMLELRQTAAYHARLPAMSGVTIAEGLIDLGEALPPTDLRTLAEAATLVTTTDLHPALVPLIITQCQELLADGGLLEEPGQFPSRQHAGLPLAEGAGQFYKSGPPFLMRYLPFRVASAIDRLKVMLLPMITLMLPLIRLAGPTYRWSIRSKIYRWYRSLREVDSRIARADANLDVSKELKALQQTREQLLALKVPLAYADSLYHLHLHYNLVINRLKALATQRSSLVPAPAPAAQPRAEQKAMPAPEPAISTEPSTKDDA